MTRLATLILVLISSGITAQEEIKPIDYLKLKVSLENNFYEVKSNSIFTEEGLRHLFSVNTGIEFRSGRFALSGQYKLPPFAGVNVRKFHRQLMLSGSINVLPKKWNRNYLGPVYYWGFTNGEQNTRFHDAGDVVIEVPISGWGIEYTRRYKAFDLYAAFQRLKFTETIPRPSGQVFVYDYKMIALEFGILLSAKSFKWDNWKKNP